ncbi:hypothetical protein [Aeromicrobium sp. PE09-221]|nr:hypothetical protein [Aeromicrobium sp. PE09-221]
MCGRGSDGVVEVAAGPADDADLVITVDPGFRDLLDDFVSIFHVPYRSVG